jgi:type IV secretory pathway TrbL component
MDKSECVQEKKSSRLVGFIILPFGLILALASFFFLPFFGLLFAVPLLVLATALIVAPESKICRLITGKTA